ncbi:hypothetical protein G6O69_07775 [Pseudenhygromyxa sp. WMMC2535]|uniref:hypothetical protein n=1 Tax=Pseudenhygromyxa sp. WMMC2535 TaxID=2712867 RepID=UPI001595E9B5|nr:hypothetical protein [Pseudenhygromyxa sp. WMMC2535]NVB37728.1 hypothetical protein [Pseudenhygromyxa sp. WMMC2535]
MRARRATTPAEPRSHRRPAMGALAATLALLGLSACGSTSASTCHERAIAALGCCPFCESDCKLSPDLLEDEQACIEHFEAGLGQLDDTAEPEDEDGHEHGDDTPPDQPREQDPL